MSEKSFKVLLHSVASYVSCCCFFDTVKCPISYSTAFGFKISFVHCMQGLKHRLFNDDAEPTQSEHWQVDVNDFLSYYRRPGHGSVENVLAAARQMAATELACTPTVRAMLREVYMKHAVVTTNPTDTGDEVFNRKRLL